MPYNSVKIDFKTFCDLYMYFYLDDEKTRQERFLTLSDAIVEKMNKIIEQDLYHQYRTAKDEQEREKLRQEYLKARGIAPNAISDKEMPYHTI